MQNQKDLGEEVCRLLEDKNYRVSGKVLAESLGMSRQHLCYIFQKQYRCSLKVYIDAKRLRRAKKLLSDNGLQIRQVGLNVGFILQKSFSRWFKNQTGLSPSEFLREQGIGSRKQRRGEAFA